MPQLVIMKIIIKIGTTIFLKLWLAYFLLKSHFFSLSPQDQTCSIYITRDIFKSLSCLLNRGMVY